MNGDRTERLQDYLDGLLPPARAAEFEALLREDPSVRREHDEMASVMSLLDTPLDVAPPATLTSRIFAALEADAAARVRLPAPVEKGLVLVGAAGLAGFITVAGRMLGPVEPAGWIGRLAVAATSGLGTAKEWLINAGGSLSHLDWIGRLLTTLSGAGRTVLASSAEPVLTITVLAFASASLLAYWLMRIERSAEEGGLHRVGII